MYGEPVWPIGGGVVEEFRVLFPIACREASHVIRLVCRVCGVHTIVVVDSDFPLKPFEGLILGDRPGSELPVEGLHNVTIAFELDWVFLPGIPLRQLRFLVGVFDLLPPRPSLQGLPVALRVGVLSEESRWIIQCFCASWQAFIGWQMCRWMSRSTGPAA